MERVICFLLLLRSFSPLMPDFSQLQANIWAVAAAGVDVHNEAQTYNAIAFISVHSD